MKISGDLISLIRIERLYAPTQILISKMAKRRTSSSSGVPEA